MEKGLLSEIDEHYVSYNFRFTKPPKESHITYHFYPSFERCRLSYYLGTDYQSFTIIG